MKMYLFLALWNVCSLVRYSHSFGKYVNYDDVDKLSRNINKIPIGNMNNNDTREMIKSVASRRSVG